MDLLLRTLYTDRAAQISKIRVYVNLHIEFEKQGNLLVGTMRGTVTYSEAVQVFKRICDACAERVLDRVLVDCLAVKGDLSTTERYGLAVEILNYLRQRDQVRTRFAMVGLPPTVNGFGALVAKNRGIAAEVFSTHQAALSWLEGV